MEMCGTGLADKGYNTLFAGREDSLFLSRLKKHPQIGLVPLHISGDFSPSTINALASIIKEKQINVALCNFVKDVRLAGLARKLTHDFKIIWTPGVNLARKTLSHKFLMAPFVDSAIVPSEHLRNAIVASGHLAKDVFHVLPIGINEHYWQEDKGHSRDSIIMQYDLPDDAFICVTSGRFVEQKGHSYLIDAAVPLVKKYPNLYFLFLGDGPLERELINQAERLNITRHFRFCGLLEDHRKVVFGADLYVHPAIIEPFGIVLVEAMGAGLPVVAARVGGIPEVVCEDETAILAEPKSSVDLTNAIDRMYTDTSLRDSMGSKGHERYQNRFMMSTMIDTLEGIIRRECIV